MFVTIDLLKKNGFKQIATRNLFLRESDGVLVSLFGENNTRMSFPGKYVLGSTISIETTRSDEKGINSFLQSFDKSPLHD